MPDKIYDLAVVGAGAAGLIAAGVAAREGNSIALIERNERVGRKIMITGKGRCNVTNNCTPEEFLRAVRANSKFLYGAINAFTPSDTVSFFTDLGVPLKTERGSRVFPVSDKAVDIVDALNGYVSHKNVKKYCTRIISFLWEDGKIVGVKGERGEKIFAKNIIIATGGKSYPQTGSTGDGYTLAKQAGHSIVPVRASLSPIVCEGTVCRDLMGLSLKNVTLTLRKNGKKKPLYFDMGEMLFAHFGISGPLVLTASMYTEGDFSDYEIIIDLKPALSFEQLDKRVMRDFEENINRDFINSLGALLPAKMIPIIAKMSEIPFDLKVHQITKEQRQKLITAMKEFKLQPKALRPIEEAVVTAGGVSLKEINPKTMESKIHSGLYFVGEVIDLDALTGGYNLQIAFSTGYVAGKSIEKGSEEK